MTKTITLGEARALAYEHYRLAPDGGATGGWWAPLRRLKLKLPNFQWRREALPIHDFHHVITGYEFTALGEFETATWEFAAGRYPNMWSTLFCLPLVCMGAAIIPRRTYAAFALGRRSRTLYGESNLHVIGDRRLSEVRAQCLPRRKAVLTARDLGGFALLTMFSALVTAGPVALILFFILKG